MTLTQPTLETLVRRGAPQTRTVYSRHGLRGQLTTVEGAQPRGPPGRWTQVSLSDSRFQYGCLLEEQGGADQQDVFHNVWSSVAPIASPRRFAPASPLQHWMD